MALRWHGGGRAALATFAGAMPAGADDPRLAFMAAVCQLEAGDFDAARLAAERVAAITAWRADGQHLLGVILSRRGDWAAAAAQLEAALPGAGAGPLANHARALLGRAKIEQQAFVEAAKLWNGLLADKRQVWGIDPVLPGLAFLAGVQALRANDIRAAAEWLTRARELKVNDPRLGGLQEHAVIQAARQLFEGEANADLDTVLPLLDKASKSRGPQQLLAALLLARIHRRHDRLPEAREALRRSGTMTVPILLEMGVTSVQDRQLSQAEEVFARARQLEPDNATVAVNLFWTRLSLGNTVASRIAAGADPARHRRRPAQPVHLFSSVAERRPGRGSFRRHDSGRGAAVNRGPVQHCEAGSCRAATVPAGPGPAAEQRCPRSADARHAAVGQTAFRPRRLARGGKMAWPACQSPADGCGAATCSVWSRA